jgi:hypothetical protein
MPLHIPPPAILTRCSALNPLPPQPKLRLSRKLRLVSRSPPQSPDGVRHTTRDLLDLLDEFPDVKVGVFLGMDVLQTLVPVFWRQRGAKG